MATLLQILAGQGLSGLFDLGRTALQQSMAESAAKRGMALKALLSGLNVESPEAQMAAAPALEELAGFKWPTVQMSAPEVTREQNRAFLTGLPSGRYPSGSTTPLAQAEQTGQEIAGRVGTTRLAGLTPNTLEDLIIGRMEPDVGGRELMGARYKQSDMDSLIKMMTLQALQGHRATQTGLKERELGIKERSAETDAAMKSMAAENARIRNMLLAQHYKTEQERTVGKQASDMLRAAEDAPTNEEALNHYKNYFRLQQQYPHLVPDVNIPGKRQGWGDWFRGVDIPKQTKEGVAGGGSVKGAAPTTGTSLADSYNAAKQRVASMPDGPEKQRQLQLLEERRKSLGIP